MLAGLDVGASYHMLYSPKTQKFHKIPAEQIDRIVSILKRDGLDGVVLEPTGSWYIPLIERLFKAGIKVYLVHTTRFRRFAASRSNVKDDKKDAYFLAEYGKLYEQGERDIVLYEVDERYIESRQMWKLWKEREALTKLKVAELNRLREQMYLKDPRYGRLKEKPLLKAALECDDERIQERARRYTEILSQINKVEAEMKDLVEKLPHMKEMVRRLTTIPYLGFTTAYFIAMQVVNVDRFNKRSFRAFVGVGRKKEQSGISKDRSRAAKSHRAFRRLLWMAAQRLIWRVPEWQRYYAWQLARVSVHKKALWRVASKLANIIYGVLRNGSYNGKYIREVVSDEQYEIAKKILRRRKKRVKIKMTDEVEYEEFGAG